ncbi:MAG: PspA/IM30 family protein [Deltaproteobacteria bacterium]|nr:PspA/IM30 family protein [Deltaproteobacteria bacterium]
MSIFNRLFKIGQSEAHAVMDKFEDPIKMTEQGIRDLKNDLKDALQSLAQVKSLAIRTRREVTDSKKVLEDYERKAMLLLTRGKEGALEMSEAERLATEALTKKEEVSSRAVSQEQNAREYEAKAAQLQSNVEKLKTTISKYENDLITLKARAKTASATKKINEQLAKVDSSGTIAMLEKMKAKVEEDESLAEAYGDMASIGTSIDSEIDKALDAPSQVDSSAATRLESLKAKMGM